MTALKAFSFTTRFYLTAALALSAVAVIFGFYASTYVREDTLDRAVKHAEAHTVEVQLVYAQNESGLTQKQWREMMESWTGPAHKIVAARVWAADGRIVRASDARLAGRRFPVTSYLRGAFAGKTVSDLIDLNDPADELDREQHQRLIKIYAPIRRGKAVVAVQEISFSVTPLYQKIKKISGIIWAANGIAFGLLFLLLSGLVGHASRRLNAQQSSLEKALETLSNHYLSTVESFNVALQSRDHYTAVHSERVTALAVALGTELGLSREELEALRIGALFHDIGKIGISDTVLLKPSGLTPAEYEQIKEHPLIGYKILAPLSSMSVGLAVVRHHHERWDGTGYPEGLRGDQIELVARIAAYADVYDALRTDRPYRASMSDAEAIATIEEMIGSHLDPSLAVAAFKIFNQNSSEPLADRAVGI